VIAPCADAADEQSQVEGGVFHGNLMAMPPATSEECSCPRCRAPLGTAPAPAFMPVCCARCGEVVWRQRTFAGFALRELLGRGEMSVTFLAFDPEHASEVALKIIRPPAAAMGPDVAAFVAAARRLKTLTHPHLVRVLAAGIEDGWPYLAMEYLPRGSLATRLARDGALDEREMLDLACQAAAALERAQNAGLPHRDFQPRRIRFADDGTIRVTGFAESIFLDCASMDIGIVRGRLCYVAPERLCGLLEDARSEIFTLGATLYETVTGRKLHDGEPHGEILRDLHDAETIRVEDTGCPLHPETAAVLNRMLSVDFADRPQTWEEARAALECARAAVKPPPAGRGRMLAVLLLLLALAAGVNVWSWSQERLLSQMAPASEAVH
jgi:serine/threonine-protein kinase